MKGEIQLKEKTSKTGAAEILIDNLLKSDEEGWYKIFLDALKEKGNISIICKTCCHRL